MKYVDVNNEEIELCDFEELTEIYNKSKNVDPKEEPTVTASPTAISEPTITPKPDVSITPTLSPIQTPQPQLTVKILSPSFEEKTTTTDEDEQDDDEIIIENTKKGSFLYDGDEELKIIINNGRVKYSGFIFKNVKKVGFTKNKTAVILQRNGRINIVTSKGKKRILKARWGKLKFYDGFVIQAVRGKNTVNLKNL